ncbi:unnamed protein product [Pleuronectes platessa]|uniref:Uncharacterized protein n=1 Tax=Pleuronectes platessa TaxID=8262 RepID=A0A9N7TUP6_PLEPL|nr:unnamed protein product [Pleuronectes platessa]
MAAQTEGLSTGSASHSSPVFCMRLDQSNRQMGDSPGALEGIWRSVFPTVGENTSRHRSHRVDAVMSGKVAVTTRPRVPAAPQDTDGSWSSVIGRRGISCNSCTAKVHSCVTISPAGIKHTDMEKESGAWNGHSEGRATR